MDKSDATRNWGHIWGEIRSPLDYVGALPFFPLAKDVDNLWRLEEGAALAGCGALWWQGATAVVSDPQYVRKRTNDPPTYGPAPKTKTETGCLCLVNRPINRLE